MENKNLLKHDDLIKEYEPQDYYANSKEPSLNDYSDKDPLLEFKPIERIGKVTQEI